MATKNAPYYSSKPNRPESLKSHRSLAAAMKAAGEDGQVWNNETKTQLQVHEMANGDWKTVDADGRVGPKMKELLESQGLINQESI